MELSLAISECCHEALEKNLPTLFENLRLFQSTRLPESSTMTISHQPKHSLIVTAYTFHTTLDNCSLFIVRVPFHTDGFLDVSRRCVQVKSYFTLYFGIYWTLVLTLFS